MRFVFMILNDVDSRTLMFCSKDPSTDTGNAVSETQISKEFRRGMRVGMYFMYAYYYVQRPGSGQCAAVVCSTLQ